MQSRASTAVKDQVEEMAISSKIVAGTEDMARTRSWAEQRTRAFSAVNELGQDRRWEKAEEQRRNRTCAMPCEVIGISNTVTPWSVRNKRAAPSDATIHLDYAATLAHTCVLNDAAKALSPHLHGRSLCSHMCLASLNLVFPPLPPPWSPSSPTSCPAAATRTAWPE